MSDTYSKVFLWVRSKLSAPLLTALLSALVGSFVGSYTSYRINAQSEKQADAFKVHNLLLLIKANLLTIDKRLESGDFVDKVMVSNLINWTDLRRDAQLKLGAELGGKVIISLLSFRALGLATEEPAFFGIATQLFMDLDRIYDIVNKINSDLSALTQMAGTLTATSQQSGPTGPSDVYTHQIKNTATRLEAEANELRKLLPPTLDRLEKEIQRFPG